MQRVSKRTLSNNIQQWPAATVDCKKTDGSGLQTRPVAMFNVSRLLEAVVHVLQERRVLTVVHSGFALSPQIQDGSEP